MAIGFDTIGQGAIGELSADGADVLIFAPVASDVTATVVAPFVAGGKSAAPAVATVTVVANAPVIRAGSKIAVPGVSVTVASSAAAVQISATETVPNAAVTVTKVAPFVGGGASITVPAAAVTMTKAAPFVGTGKSEFPATAGVTIVANAPGISISATETVPNAPVTITPLPPQILGGNYIEANNTITMNTLYGEIGSSSIGEFAIGEGDAATRIVKIPPIVIVSVKAPFITAGKTQKPPAANVTVTSSRAEIDGRSRKLRVFAIAS